MNVYGIQRCFGPNDIRCVDKNSYNIVQDIFLCATY